MHDIRTIRADPAAFEGLLDEPAYNALVEAI